MFSDKLLLSLDIHVPTALLHPQCPYSALRGSPGLVSLFAMLGGLPDASFLFDVLATGRHSYPRFRQCVRAGLGERLLNRLDSICSLR